MHNNNNKDWWESPLAARWHLPIPSSGPGHQSSVNECPGTRPLPSPPGWLRSLSAPAPLPPCPSRSPNLRQPRQGWLPMVLSRVIWDPGNIISIQHSLYFWKVVFFVFPDLSFIFHSMVTTFNWRPSPAVFVSSYLFIRYAERLPIVFHVKYGCQ